VEISPLVALLVAAGLGLVVGLEREWAGTPIAGIRTFPLITLLGALTATLAARFGGWMVPAGLLALGILIAVAEWGETMAAREKDATAAGITTTVAVLVMFGVGAALQAGFLTEAVVLAGIVSVLLHAKRPLHGLVDRIGEDDARAVFRFVLIALVILPLLPDRTFDRYGVLNPFKIWLMVVLIVGISLAAYVASKLLGRRGGLVATGLLGGLISSTATTVSQARASRRSPKMADGAAFIILVSSTVVFVRVLIEIAVVAPATLREIGPPLLAVLIWMAALAAASFRKLVQDAEPPGDPEPPSELSAAITFGALYAVVLLAVATTKENFGNRALFLVAGLSGLTDMDAITLSTAELVNAERLEPATGWRLILVGAMANLVFKAAVVTTLGDRRLRSRIAVLFGLALAGAALVLWLWPS
jgi:uncharacterized membrane protein (DUF4010 family)